MVYNTFYRLIIIINDIMLYCNRYQRIKIQIYQMTYFLLGTHNTDFLYGNTYVYLVKY